MTFMNTTDRAFPGWARRPLGKTARVVIGGGGMLISFMLMLLAAMLEGQSWLLVFAAAALAATSIRAAQAPSISRLSVMAMNLIALPLLAVLI
jgi:hypothetical protein